MFLLPGRIHPSRCLAGKIEVTSKVINHPFVVEVVLCFCHPLHHPHPDICKNIAIFRIFSKIFEFGRIIVLIVQLVDVILEVKFLSGLPISVLDTQLVYAVEVVYETDAIAP